MVKNDIEVLYPKPEKKRKDPSQKYWRVEYTLNERGMTTTAWSEFYWTRIGARIAAWNSHKNYGPKLQVVLIYQPVEARKKEVI